MKKNERITICVDSEMKESFRVLAEKTGVSMSALGRVMLNLNEMIKNSIKDAMMEINFLHSVEEEEWTVKRKVIKKDFRVGIKAKIMNTPMLNEIRKNPIFIKQKSKYNTPKVDINDLKAPPRAPSRTSPRVIEELEIEV